MALGLGLFVLLGVLGLSIAVKVDNDQFTQLATVVIGVVGSIVGAYFGVKVGTDGTEKALEAQRQDSARAQVFAAHLPPDAALQALQLAFPAPPTAAPPNPAGGVAPPNPAGGTAPPNPAA